MAVAISVVMMFVAMSLFDYASIDKEIGRGVRRKHAGRQLVVNYKMGVRVQPPTLFAPESSELQSEVFIGEWTLIYRQHIDGGRLLDR